MPLGLISLIKVTRRFATGSGEGKTRFHQDNQYDLVSHFQIYAYSFGLSYFKVEKLT